MTEQKARYISLLIVAVEVFILLLYLVFVTSPFVYEHEYFKAFLYLYGGIFVLAALILFSVFYKIVYHFFAAFELIAFVIYWILVNVMHPVIIFFFVIMLLKHFMYYKSLFSSLKQQS